MKVKKLFRTPEEAFEYITSYHKSLAENKGLTPLSARLYYSNTTRREYLCHVFKYKGRRVHELPVYLRKTKRGWRVISPSQAPKRTHWRLIKEVVL